MSVFGCASGTVPFNTSCNAREDNTRSEYIPRTQAEPKPPYRNIHQHILNCSSCSACFQETTGPETEMALKCHMICHEKFYNGYFCVPTRATHEKTTREANTAHVALVASRTKAKRPHYICQHFKHLQNRAVAKIGL